MLLVDDWDTLDGVGAKMSGSGSFAVRVVRLVAGGDANVRSSCKRIPYLKLALLGCITESFSQSASSRYVVAKNVVPAECCGLGSERREQLAVGRIVGDT